MDENLTSTERLPVHIDTDDLSPMTMRVSLLQIKILNALAFIITVAINGISAAGVLSPYKVGDVSRMHPTKIVPAGGAFSIWSVIYTIETIFILYSLFCWPNSENDVLHHGIGFWFASGCLFNSLWIVTFVQGNTESLWCSTVLIYCLLFSLCKMYLGAECWVKRRTGGSIQSFVLTLLLDVHLSMYCGWVTVATIVATSATLTSTGWKGEPFNESAWSVIMLCVALLINSYIVIQREDCVWGFVLAWASAWIAVKNGGDTAVVVGSLLVCSLISIVSIVITVRVMLGCWRSKDNIHIIDHNIDLDDHMADSNGRDAKGGFESARVPEI